MAVGWCGRTGGSTMPCESCAAQFTVFKRKRACCDCDRYYCSRCLSRGMCAPCRILSTRPSRDTIASLKVRDLQCFLQRQNVSTRGCVEKEELVRLCEVHVNSALYRRRGQRAGAGPFSTFTNNINDFINSAFDLRNSPTPQEDETPRGYSSSCFNSSHLHGSVPPPTTPPQLNSERFTTRPGGETDIDVPIPDTTPQVSRSSSDEVARVDTADCFEVEDLDEAGWEFVNRPADPLPNDSPEVLIPVPRDGVRRPPTIVVQPRPSPLARPAPASPARAPAAPAPAPAPGELHDVPLTRDPPRDSHVRAHSDTASLQDEQMTQSRIGIPTHIGLEQFKASSDLDLLNVKQLKELLARNRVEYRGCLERADLLLRAKTLWANHQQYTDDVENLPLEECCKICMAAPLECVLLECGHMAACTRCSTQLAECPICRQYVVRAVRVFRS